LLSSITKEFTMLTRALLISIAVLNILLTTLIWVPMTILPMSTTYKEEDQEQAEATLGILFCPKEEERCFLLPLSDFVGSLGYSSSSFYSSIFPVWEDILISTTIFSMLMTVSNITLFVYSTCYFKTKYCKYTIYPWLCFSIPTLLAVISFLFFLMVDLSNPDRVMRERQAGGHGVYAKTISVTIVMILYLILSIMVAIIHLISQSSSSPSKTRSLPIAMMYRDISLKPEATSTPVVERRRLDGHAVQLDHGGHIAQLDNNGYTAQLDHGGHGYAPLDMDQELEFCAPWLHQYSAASFPDDQVIKDDAVEKDEPVEQDVKGFVDEKDIQTDNEDETLKLSNISIGSGFD